MDKTYGQKAKLIRQQKIKNQLTAAYDKRDNGNLDPQQYASVQAEIISLETQLRSLDSLYTEED